jgi:hypothetical protein
LASVPHSDLPAPERDQERAFLATPRHSRSSVRDEFNTIRTAMNQAADLETLGDTPLAVVNARRDADVRLWIPRQEDLTTLSTNSVHQYLPNATHAMVVEDEDTAHQGAPSDPRRHQLHPHQHSPINAQEG